MTAGSTLAYPRRPTAWTAAVVFVLFVVLVFALRFAARVDSPDLGLSAWGERAATEKRLEPVVDQLLNKAAIGAFIARHASESPASLPESQPKLWTVIEETAGAVTDDKAKARLSTAWAAELARKESAETIRAKVREYLRLSPSSSACCTVSGRTGACGHFSRTHFRSSATSTS